MWSCSWEDANHHSFPAVAAPGIIAGTNFLVDAILKSVERFPLGRFWLVEEVGIPLRTEPEITWNDVRLRLLLIIRDRVEINESCFENVIGIEMRIIIIIIFGIGIIIIIVNVSSVWISSLPNFEVVVVVFDFVVAEDFIVVVEDFIVVVVIVWRRGMEGHGLQVVEMDFHRISLRSFSWWIFWSLTWKLHEQIKKMLWNIAINCRTRVINYFYKLFIQKKKK